MRLIAITILSAIIPSSLGQHPSANVELKVDGKGALVSEKKLVAHSESHEASKVIRKELKHDVMAPDDADDVALDELEAMTISSALSKKHWSPPPAVNCRWTPWTDEGDCSKTCGGGKQKQKRRKAPNAAHGGKGCSGDPRKEVKCNDDDCPTTTTTTPATTTMTTAAGAMRMVDVTVLPFLSIWLLVWLSQ